MSKVSVFGVVTVVIMIVSFVCLAWIAPVFPLIVEVEVIKEVEIVKEVEVVPDTPDLDIEVWKSIYPYDVDCDDIALATWIALEKLGYDCYGVFGNLELKGETIDDCNHVWIIACIDGIPCYYENGEGHELDKRHAEGYRLSKRDLFRFVVGDLPTTELEHIFGVSKE